MGQLQGPGLLSYEGVRATLDYEGFAWSGRHVLGQDLAAPATAAFQYGIFERWATFLQ